ncbi:MAG: MATE family efflux transporter [Anaerolineae bacterium]|nr:MATE family efflux transporter [Anaerolineae bacterium]
MTAASAAPQTLDLSLNRLNRTIVRLALPSVAESLLSTLVYLADTILLGWMDDPVALAAVGLSGTLMWAADGLFQAISISASALVARFWGEENFEQAREVAGQSLLLTVIVSLLLMAFFIPVARGFMVLMNAEPAVVEQGAVYMQIILAASPISFLLTTANSIMRAAGDTQRPLYTSGLMNVIKVIGAYALIFGLGPIPRLGLAGAAISTSVARAFGGALALILLFVPQAPIRLRLAHLWRWDWALIRRILRISLPNIGETVISRLGFMLFTRILSELGTVAIAAHQVALRVESLGFMPGWGMAVAAAALVGQALGAKKPAVAELGIRRALVLTNLTMALLGGCFVLFAPGIVRVFGIKNAEMTGLAIAVVRISALELFGLGSLMVLGGCLRGAGDTRTPMVVTLIGTFFFRVPITYLSALTLGGGLRGLWLGTVIDWSMRALVMCVLYLRGRWKTVEV